MKFAKLILIFSLLVPIVTNAQKIKYKDLFPSLNSKVYNKENETKLNTFLANEKKPHANGNLQMGFIYEDRFYKSDILQDTVFLASLADSVVTQIKLAISLIDEKEIKKNEEYYQSFYRRDLRTGEFGIKISDVHLDLEKKIQGVIERRDAIRKMHTQLHRLSGRNKLSLSIYKQMIEKSQTSRDLSFALGEEDMALLDQVINNATGLYVLVDDIKETALELGSDYYQSFNTFKIIETFGADGVEQSDIFTGEISLWDYETWAKSIKEEYAGVKGYRTEIHVAENKLGDALNKVEQGIDPGAVVMNDLSKDATRYDPDGSAASLVELRSSLLEVKKLSSPQINPVIVDSLNVYARLEAANKIMEELGTMTTVYSDISTPDKLELASNRYPGILEDYYGGTSGYNDFISNLGGWLNDQTILWASTTDLLATKDLYATSEEEQIPLFLNEDDNDYRTLVVAKGETKIAAGIQKDNGGYLVWSGPQRGISSKIKLKSGQMNLTATVGKELPLAAFGFYFYDSSLTENNLFLAATSNMGEMKWSNLITAPNEPMSFRYDEVLDQLTVFYYPEDQLPGEGVTAYIVIDRSGAVR